MTMDEDVPVSCDRKRLDENSNDSSCCELEQKRFKSDHEQIDQCKSILPTSSTITNGSSTNVKSKQLLEINSNLTDNVQALKQIYNDELMDDLLTNQFIQQNFTVLQKPFRVVHIKNFCLNPSVFESIGKLISQTELHQKRNDLYTLKQSIDLHNHSTFDTVCKFFENDVRKFVENITGIQLNSKVSLTISRYDKNDFLLCHDDQLETRKVAFILYFVDPNWSESDGGLLELFQCNQNDGQPMDVVQRLVPCWNQFNFFEVHPLSYHQVSEVLTDQYPRLSINGWFHCDTIRDIKRNYTFPFVSTIRDSLAVAKSDVSYELIKSWINPSYFIDLTQREVQTSFIHRSEFQLQKFLRDSKCNQLSEALKCVDETVWQQYCYPVLAKYEYIPEQLLINEQSTVIPKIVLEFFKVFCSEAFCLILSNLTGLRLHSLATLSQKHQNQSGPSRSMCKIRGEIRRWRHGHYSIANDLNPEASEKKALDIMMFFGLPDISEDIEDVDDEEADDDDDDDDSILSVHTSDDQMDTSEVHCSVTSEQKKSLNYNGNIMTPSTSGTTAANKIEEIIISDSDESDDPITSQTPNVDSTEPEIINLDDEDDEDEDDDDDLDEELGDVEDDISEHNEFDEMLRNDGGYITYVHPSIDHELLSIVPRNNSLNMVYRTKDTQRVMHLIKRCNTLVPFYQLSFVYYETK